MGWTGTGHRGRRGGEVGAAYGHFVISPGVQHRTPWLLLPGLSSSSRCWRFSFVGDGLRDSADPYATRDYCGGRAIKESL